MLYQQETCDKGFLFSYLMQSLFYAREKERLEVAVYR